MELVALATLGSVAIYLGVSDWKNRTVDIRGVLACYGVAACVNGAVILTGDLARPDIDISLQTTLPAREKCPYLLDDRDYRLRGLGCSSPSRSRTKFLDLVL